MRYGRAIILAAAALLALGVASPLPGGERGPVRADHYDGPREMFGELGFSEGQTDVFIVRMQDVTPQKYKFADSTTTPNTIDTPWTTVAALGAAEVEFDQLIGLAKEFECNTLHASGLRTFCVTNGPQTGVRYTVIITMFDGPFPTDDTGGLSVNLSWPTNVAGLPGWQAQGPFIGDTWQQAGRIPPYVINEPWGMQVSQLDANGSLMDDASSQAFGLVHGNTLAMFSPTMELMQGQPTLEDLSYGFAIHVHDGSFGACDSCRSTITPIPAFPREGLMRFDERELIIAGLPDPEPSGSTSNDTTGGGSAPSPAAGAGSTTGSDTTGGGSSRSGSTSGGSSGGTTGGSSVATGGGSNDTLLYAGLAAGLALIGGGGCSSGAAASCSPAVRAPGSPSRTWSGRRRGRRGRPRRIRRSSRHSAERWAPTQT